MGKPTSGIAVDGACSGNPGQAEYKIVDIATGKTLVSRKIGIATNNHAEFIGLCHALYSYPNEAIYSDSVTAISWVKNKKVNSKHPHPDVDRCIKMLEGLNKKVEIIKWDTRVYGEIPADFGRKK
jgi:ribonuclease HI